MSAVRHGHPWPGVPSHFWLLPPPTQSPSHPRSHSCAPASFIPDSVNKGPVSMLCHREVCFSVEPGTETQGNQPLMPQSPKKWAVGTGARLIQEDPVGPSRRDHQIYLFIYFLLSFSLWPNFYPTRLLNLQNTLQFTEHLPSFSPWSRHSKFKRKAGRSFSCP